MPIHWYAVTGLPRAESAPREADTPPALPLSPGGSGCRRSSQGASRAGPGRAERGEGVRPAPRSFSLSKTFTVAIQSLKLK